MTLIRKNNGFTLIELMITIMVLAILVMIAVPTFGTILNKQNLNKSTNELIGILIKARSVAVLERRNVSVAVGLTDENEIEDINAAGNLYWTPVGNSFLKSGQTTITFMLSGLVKDQNSNQVAAGDTSFNICDQAVDSQRSKTISISKLGKVQQVIDGDCI